MLLGALAVVDFAMADGVSDPEVMRLLRQQHKNNHKGNTMANCSICGLGLVKAEEAESICYKCKNNSGHEKIREMRVAAKARHDGIIITTEAVCPDLQIEKRLNIITAECVFGMNVFRDFFASVTDIVGGRSEATQKVFRQARQVVLDDLRQQAYDAGANAVIAVSVQYSQLPGKGASMLMVAATGTAVVVQ